MRTSKVRLVPSDREFTVQGEETVLEAALRAGIAVSYGCSNGNCGDCRARVLSGSVRKTRHHDHVFNEAEKLQGYTLMCSVTPASDLVLETGVAQEWAQIPFQTIAASVRGTERPGPGRLILRVQTPRTRRLRFLAGQSVRLSVGGGAHAGVLPLANCPCDDRNLVFHLAENPRDALASYCFGRLRNGETVEVAGPQGDFVLTDESPGPLLFLACETGFAPVRSLVEHVLARETTEAIHLIWMAAESTGHYQDNLCRAWRDAMDHFHYQAVIADHFTEPDQARAVMADALASLDQADRYQCFIAGPAGFVSLARDTALAGGIHPERCHTESLAGIAETAA